MKSEFEWDPNKAITNLRKHGVTFAEASSVFDNPLFITLLDKEHSSDEERFITIGLSNKNRLVMVAHAERANRIRIITKHEEKFYQEAG